MATITYTTCDRCNLHDVVTGWVVWPSNVLRELPYVPGNIRSAKHKGYEHVGDRGLCCPQCVTELANGKLEV